MKKRLQGKRLGPTEIPILQEVQEVRGIKILSPYLWDEDLFKLIMVHITLPLEYQGDP